MVALEETLRENLPYCGGEVCILGNVTVWAKVLGHTSLTSGALSPAATDV